MYPEQTNVNEKQYTDDRYTSSASPPAQNQGPVGSVPPYNADSFHQHGAGSPPPQFAQQPYPQSGTPVNMQPQTQQNFQPYAQAHVTSHPDPMMHDQKPQPQVQMAQMNAPQPYAQPLGHGQPVGNGPDTTRYQTAVPIQSIGMAPAPIDCPNCKQRALTRTEKHAGNTTHAWAFVTCCLTGCLCFIPYLMDGLKDVDHYCGNCGAHVAKWHKSGNVEVLLHG